MFTRTTNHHEQSHRSQDEAAAAHGLGNSHATAQAAAMEDGVIVIGKGTRVEGKIGACSKLDVHGILEADVETHTLIIRKGGGVRGEITAEHAEILGVVEGKLTVRRHLEVQPTGQVSGEISYSSIAIHTGGRILGNIAQGEEPVETPATAEEPVAEAEVIQFSGVHVSR